jgi:DNA-binding NarL/FixJ family response regulator
MYQVYVVEDSPSICEVLMGSLESSGLIEVVGHADNSEAAWEDPNLARAHSIIIDLALRASSGFELLGRLRASERFKDVTKIVLTNYAIGAFRQRAMALGTNYFFDKSLQFDQAIDLLDALARDHAQRGANPST